MSNPSSFDQSLNVRLRYSIALTLLHLMVATLAIYMLQTTGQYSIGLQFALALAVLLSIGNSLYRTVLRLPAEAIVGLSCSQNRWRLQKVDGEWLPAELQTGIYLSTWCIVATFKHAKRTERIVLTRDGLSADQFRLTYVRLRFSQNNQR